MGSGSEDEDEEGSSVGHQHPGGVGVPHLNVHSLGPSVPGDQVVGSGTDLPLGNDPCKQEDSEDQGKSTKAIRARVGTQFMSTFHFFRIFQTV